MFRYKAPRAKHFLWDLLVALILGVIPIYGGYFIYLFPEWVWYVPTAAAWEIQAYGQFQLYFTIVINYYLLTHLRGRTKVRKIKKGA
jgi:hypothetical protein